MTWWQQMMQNSAEGKMGMAKIAAGIGEEQSASGQTPQVAPIQAPQQAGAPPMQQMQGPPMKSAAGSPVSDMMSAMGPEQVQGGPPMKSAAGNPVGSMMGAMGQGGAAPSTGGAAAPPQSDAEGKVPPYEDLMQYFGFGQ